MNDILISIEKGQKRAVAGSPMLGRIISSLSPKNAVGVRAPVM
jgi:hypothetical protein